MSSTEQTDATQPKPLPASAKEVIRFRAAREIRDAAIEILVHAEGTKIPPRAVTGLRIPESISIEGTDWMEHPASRDFGDRWVREQRSVALRVPGVVAGKLELNFVFNPASQTSA